jgi:hypothetical protein
MKSITREDTIYEIYSHYPQIVDILYEFGFTQIRQPMMIQTVGRYMTLRKGCEMRGFDVEELKRLLRSKGLPMEE